MTVEMDELLDGAVDVHCGEAIELLTELVGVKSVNPLQPGVEARAYLGGEARANGLLGERLASVGMGVEMVEKSGGRANMVAIRHGIGGGRSLALSGHIDTVAPQRGRLEDPWKAHREGDRLYGLGATDMKAGLVAMWLAAKAIDSLGIRLRGDLHVHSAVGEETMSHEVGTDAILDAGYSVDGVLVAEPTSSSSAPFVLSNTAAGNYLFSITVRGRSTHWASRNLAIRPGGGGDSIGVNAIDRAFYVYAAMRQLEEQWGHSKRHPQFPPGAFIIHPGVMRADVGIPSAAYFPDRARLDYLLSFPPGQTAEQIREEVTNHIVTASSLDPWLREHPVEFEWTDTWPPAYTDPSGEFARTVLEVRNAVADKFGFDTMEAPVPAGAQSDASFYEERGIPALVCGPGDLLVAHSADESVDVTKIPVAAKLMARLAVRWCGAARGSDLPDHAEGREGPAVVVRRVEDPFSGA